MKRPGLLAALAAVAGVGAALDYGAPDPESQAPLAVGGKRRLVSSELLQDAISGEKLFARAKELYEIAKLGEEEYNRPTRVIGSEGHLGTLLYIHSALADLGDYYNLSSQSFPAVVGNVFESRLVIADRLAESAEPMSLTPPTEYREPVSGDVVLVENDGCDLTDYPAHVRGNIALVRRGTCSFGKKSGNAGKSGAVAAVIYNHESGTVHGTLGQPSPDHVATFGLSREEADGVIARLRRGESVDATAFVDAEVKTVETHNLVAQTAAGDPENCVMLGGHSDSVADGPGINDDGSGSLSLVEVAAQLARFDVRNCVRFAWWAAEEEGLLGSDFYVASLSPEENRRIRVFMDFDMLASPNFAYQVYNATNDAHPVGSQELRDLYVRWYEARGLPYTFIPFDGRSDYDGFIRHGIPAGGIATGAEGVKTEEEAALFGGRAGEWYDPCYHQLCDDLSNVNVTAWEINTKLVAHAVAHFAVSFEGFPERSDAVVADDGAGTYGQRVRYHGSRLFV
ncbi:hypothetical protein VTK73DRAFT_4565 [Phialemonium thermophilum]|uniref:Peptide hydrolase n=1 Tax=Phialemonium thermophilum TaxID=223376 RepID=A0ABR3WT69_9PEZI